MTGSGATADPLADALSGTTLRVLLGAATAALLATVLTGVGMAPGWLGGGLVMVASVVVASVMVGRHPDSPVPTLVSGAAVVIYVVGGAPVGLVLAIGPLLHAAHVLAGLAAVVPPPARIERPALRPALRRWATTQAATFPVLVVAAVLL